MLKAVLIDDEEIALRELVYVLSQYEEIHIAGAFTDPIEALKKISAIKPDVIFLDIEMPEINGFAVAEQLMHMASSPYVVFVTAYDEYALKAFEVNAVDYILKPISPKRIGKTIQKLIKNHAGDRVKKEAKESMQKKIETVSKTFSDRLQKILIFQEEEIILLKPSDIFYFMTEDKGVVAVTGKQKYQTRETLNYWEEKLEHQNFFRCHRCYLVNLEKVERICPMFNSTYLMHLAGHPAEIPVSRTQGKKLKEIME